VLFSLKKIVKIAKRWGLCPQTPVASGGWELRSQTPTSVILHCEFFSLHLAICPQSTESTKRSYFLVIIAGVHQPFGVEK